MTDIVDCPALHARHIAKGYPFGDKVPKTVRLKCRVRSDFPFLNPVVVAETGITYPAWTNSYGAVAAVFPDGRTLGLKPDEFEIVDWHGSEP